jgi:hypothetical protein
LFQSLCSMPPQSAAPLSAPPSSLPVSVMRIGLRISVTDRSQITNSSADTQILKWRTTWGNLCSIFLIQRDFDYLPRLFWVSITSAAERRACGRARLRAPAVSDSWVGYNHLRAESR